MIWENSKTNVEKSTFRAVRVIKRNFAEKAVFCRYSPLCARKMGQNWGRTRRKNGAEKTVTNVEISECFYYV